MKKLFLATLFVTACGGGGGGGSATAPSVDTPVTPPAGDEYVVPAAKPQLSFTEVTARDLFARPGDAIDLEFTVDNPSAEPLKCNWFMELPANPGLGFAGIAKHHEGTVDGPCTPWTHNQTNQLDKIYWVYIKAGDLTLEYQWNVTYTASVANDPVSIQSATAAGTYRIHDSKKFDVVVVDKDRDGVCSWRIDGVQVSTSCATYTIAAASGTRTLSFSIDDGPTDDAESWTIKPAAKVTGLTPASANVANGASQVFTATLSDANSSGALCEFYDNGSLAQARGACTYNYTGNGSSHTVQVRAVYDAGGAEVDSTIHYASALGPVNNGVSVDSFLPAHTTKMYFTAGQTSNTFGVDAWTDTDGDARFEWYLNGIKVDCAVSPKCTYTSPVIKNGISLDNISETTVIKVVLTDGQYSSSKTWLTHMDTMEINENQPTVVGKNAGAEFFVFGKGFESTDTFSIPGHGTLQKVEVNGGYAKLKTSFALPAGSAKSLRVEKTWNSNQALPGSPGYASVTSSVGLLQVGF